LRVSLFYLRPTILCESSSFHNLCILQAVLDDNSF